MFPLKSLFNLVLVIGAWLILRDTFEFDQVQGFPWTETVGVALISLLYGLNLFGSWIGLGLFLALFLFSVLMWISKLTLNHISGF